MLLGRPSNYFAKGIFRTYRRVLDKMSGGDSVTHAKLNELKVNYRDKRDVFTEKDLVAKEPIAQFKDWFDLAVQKGISEPNAMCLATCTKEGYPSARYVLLKGYGKDGFRFFTNYKSRKGMELAVNPRAALVFYWEPLKRSVRIEGTVEKIPAADSDEYFASRWRDSQIGTSVSAQSSVIPSRETLSNLEEKMKLEYEGKEIPRPEFWGGYKVIPHTIEFWQGQTDRIHDRIRFRRPKGDEKPDDVMLHQGEDGWVFERLSP
ncbi:pyridoxine/pyridoxamine 5'-phosphate oxidase-like [Ischnura elegans]|uniref:pyridoxine/pyridoxamine 5'-phosphate oxidase-like n=1 Tax=Ischnura elegans TaxID=197161 RepID=UPI001ED8BA4E|nr:pyridoxine/pyridoxamine 5'-phosphate oxidase-like [Ischnura elegans]